MNIHPTVHCGPITHMCGVILLMGCNIVTEIVIWIFVLADDKVEMPTTSNTAASESLVGVKTTIELNGNTYSQECLEEQSNKLTRHV